MYRSLDGGATWEEITGSLPSDFGFVVGAHPRDPETAWVIPLEPPDRGRTMPAGSAAVLLNPTHKHTDLVLPIDAMEAGLLSQIDGARSLGDIAHERLGSKAQQRALQFFRKLWEYDQIVIDASGQDVVSVRNGPTC